MAIHLLNAVIAAFGTNDNIKLIKMCRHHPPVQGISTLSDLFIGDQYYQNTLYPVEQFDKLYNETCQWGDLYLPTEQENLIIIKIIYQWCKHGPFPYTTIYDYTDTVNRAIGLNASRYVMNCIAVCGACRSLLGKISVELDKFCEDILLYMKDCVASESEIIITDSVLQRIAERRSINKRKLNH